MAEPELFVICPNCGSEVSPYVTECPYCGNRLRKRAPDLKKDRKQREKAAKKAEKDAEKQRKRTKSLLTGRGGGAELPEYLSGSRPPIAVSLLILASIAISVASRARGFPPVDWVFGSDLSNRPWLLFTSPFIFESFGYGFVSLLAIAMFGSGLERRFGAAAVIAIWLVCGAAGVVAEHLMAPDTLIANGSIAISVGMMAAWLVHVLQREDLRDYDPYGLIAVSAVLFAMPLVTDEASVWMIVGGLIGGTFCGFVLLLRTASG
ncbi:MAG: rhomboid family intramembrane serine protease [Actinobacteria bacterium]|nr:rhomboid family intramembrane serine protease [Actinomycetota bacterium]